MTRRLRHGALATLVALAVVAGCGSPSPSALPGLTSAPAATGGSAAPSPGPSGAASSSAAPTSAPAAATCSQANPQASFSPRPIGPDDPNAALLATIEGAVESIRGITATRAVPRYTLDQAGLCAFLRESLARDNPPAQVAATEALYKQLDLMPAGDSLEATYLDLLTSQVVGFYDQRSKSMYVVASSGAMGPAEEITYAHEFDHALQDQRFGLQAVVGDAKDQGDRTLARTALVEGDATLAMSLWAQRSLTPSQLLQIAGATDPASQAALNAAPAILRETLLWPYTQGLSYVLSAYQTSASFVGVDALWQHPPDTTEQLLHPDQLASREPAVTVTLPMGLARRLGAGWSVAMEDTLGELRLNILMRTGDPGAGSDPAAGWGGDRVALVEGPNGARAAVVDTVWDGAKAAGSAFDQLDQLAVRLNGEGRHAAVLAPSPQRVVLLSADSAGTLSAVANALGLAG